MLLRVNVTV